MLVGLIFNIIFGTQLDVQFKGGAMIKYSYTGDVEPNKIEQAVESAVKRDVSVATNMNVKSADSDELTNNVTLTFAGNAALSVDDQKTLLSTLQSLYPKANFKL
jgi:preprotein translocase subunit SecF